ncbi:hypothetical protein DFA_03877 [Cavenderia fasciculata]|uniref:Uncharacterized protein n=1 Tax=Cavenderia fasciculata TaxID=261658 RepID=F4Q0N2_CACFS|nr:uncharacterized protein DFA_03877 [Cavenderia fasciculata]EGG18383.1 hypothetical protein DFA_03877 [Cavenderia fasciculata]|eukprot:XP_004366287.1 hypothetical protein DFA_03877 [Cavenderia fasciculata]
MIEYLEEVDHINGVDYINSLLYMVISFLSL